MNTTPYFSELYRNVNMNGDGEPEQYVMGNITIRGFIHMDDKYQGHRYSDKDRHILPYSKHLSKSLSFQSRIGIFKGNFLF